MGAIRPCPECDTLISARFPSHDCKPKKKPAPGIKGVKQTIMFLNQVGKTLDPVDAVVYGPVAIHATPLCGFNQFSDNERTITHLESGFAIRRTSEPYKAVVSAAKEMAVLDWRGIKNDKSKKALARIAPSVIDIIKRYDL